MSEILTLAAALAKANMPRDASDEIAQAVSAVIAAEAKALEDRMNREVQAAVDRASANFQGAVRDQTRWLAIIMLSSVGTIIATIGLSVALLKLH